MTVGRCVSGGCNARIASLDRSAVVSLLVIVAGSVPMLADSVAKLGRRGSSQKLGWLVTVLSVKRIGYWLL